MYEGPSGKLEIRKACEPTPHAFVVVVYRREVFTFLSFTSLPLNGWNTANTALTPINQLDIIFFSD